MKKACVIGHPIGHSRSPLIHGYWLKKHKVQGSYDRLDIAPRELQRFLATLAQSEYCGCNVTSPHKETAAMQVDILSPASKLLRSVNTIYVRDGNTHGTSTDGEGFYQNLLHHIPGFTALGSKAVILGAGGSASAIIGELRAKGLGRISVCNRTHVKAQEVRARFGNPVVAIQQPDLLAELRDCDLLINTTSQGMNGLHDIVLPLDELPSRCIVADIVYIPLKTSLVLRAETRGLRVVPGLGMLLHQAVPGFELWFGVRPEVTQELLDLVAADITSAMKS